ncbi:MAG: DUF4105 domain-containing protein [Bacteroides sp.]|nr:DUF4105 domain-containing protein [Bacteroides sp.]
MSRYIHLFLIIFSFFSGATTPLMASTLPQQADSLSPRFSLLTCSPGEEIYSYFGHTAIRMIGPGTDRDIVFNYGVFSFNAPNFILRFALGETDYQLAVTDYHRFAAEYDYYNRGITEQVLSLSPSEARKLAELLEENYLPGNRVYRYNFFYDNCATRPRDIIEKCIEGKIVYHFPDNLSQSYRDIIHAYTQGHDWGQFGIDLCLGSQIDTPITQRQKTFVPDYLLWAFRDAEIIAPDGSRRALVSAEHILLPARTDTQSQGFCLSPLSCALLLFMTVVFFTIYGLRRKKSLWGVDTVLFAAAGIAGCVLAFLVFLSQHPGVSPNYLLFVFHPLHLLLLPFFVYKEKKKRRSIYHVANSVTLTFFILFMAVLPQRIEWAVVPLALCLLVRSVSNLILTYRERA